MTTTWQYRFYGSGGITLLLTIENAVSTFANGDTIGNSDSNPNLQMGSINGNIIGLSKPIAESFSTSAAIGDSFSW